MRFIQDTDQRRHNKRHEQNNVPRPYTAHNEGGNGGSINAQNTNTDNTENDFGCYGCNSSSNCWRRASTCASISFHISRKIKKLRSNHASIIVEITAANKQNPATQGGVKKNNATTPIQRSTMRMQQIICTMSCLRNEAGGCILRGVYIPSPFYTFLVVLKDGTLFVAEMSF